MFFIIFALLSLVFGVHGLIQGTLTCGLGESDDADRVVSGGVAKIISFLLIVSSAFLFSGSKIGFIILAVIFLVVFIVAKN